MSIGMIFLLVLTLLILFGVLQRVLDRMALTDKQALILHRRMAARFAYRHGIFEHRRCACAVWRMRLSVFSRRYGKGARADTGCFSSDCRCHLCHQSVLPFRPRDHAV